MSERESAFIGIVIGIFPYIILAVFFWLYIGANSSGYGQGQGWMLIGILFAMPTLVAIVATLHAVLGLILFLRDRSDIASGIALFYFFAAMIGGLALTFDAKAISALRALI